MRAPPAALWRTLWGYMWRWKLHVVLTVLAAGLTAGLELAWIGLVVPLLSMITGQLDRNALPEIVRAVDGLWAGLEGSDKLWALIGTIAVVAVLRGVTGLGYAYAIALLNSRVNLDVKKDLTRKIFGLGWIEFQRYRTSDLTFYIGPQSHNVGQMLQSLLAHLPTLFGLVSVLAVSFILSVELTLLALVLFAGVGMLFRPLLHGHETVARRVKDEFKETQFLASDTLLGFKPITVAARQDYFRDRLMQQLVGLARLQVRLFTIVGMTPWMVQATALVGMALLLAATLVFYGYSRETLVLFALLFIIVTRMVGHLQSLMGLRTSISNSLPATREILGFLAAEEMYLPPPDGSRTDLTFEEALEFEDVGFRYPRDDGFAIRNVSFRIRPGERVGIVGMSGSGKSTVVDLMSKALAPTQGRISLDGVEQSDASTEAWQSMFGIVPQDAYLMNGSIADNIRFGNDGLGEEKLREAAGSAAILDFVEQLPEGFGTVVGDRGLSLSGGQRQRVAIARALANRRRILVFDEATSALDAISEQEVQRAIDQLAGRLAVVVVAHRMATLQGCTKVIVLEGGRVAESGSIRELLERRGVFHRLSRQQGLDRNGASRREQRPA